LFLTLIYPLKKDKIALKCPSNKDEVMISTETIKDIIKSNEDFILNEIKNIVKRENIFFPSGVRKVNIIYGVRRSGKTFLLYDIFKKNTS